MASRATAQALVGALLCWTLACAQLPGRTRGDETSIGARVVGRVTASADGPLGAAAVFLEPVVPVPSAEALEAVVIGQRSGRFEPAVAITAVGQPLLFVNRDRIFQAAFSYSSPNDFECAALAPGDTCMVWFREPGVVRIYSPLDAEPHALVFVVPDRHHAVPDERGNFAIDGVAAGRYRVTVWTEQHGHASREISVVAGETARATFALEALVR